MSERLPHERLTAAADIIESTAAYQPPGETWAVYSVDELFGGETPEPYDGSWLIADPGEDDGEIASTPYHEVADWIALLGPDKAPHLVTMLRTLARIGGKPLNLPTFSDTDVDALDVSALFHDALAFADSIIGESDDVST